MTDDELDEINRKRRAQGLPPLTRETARSAIGTRDDEPGFDSTGFLIGYGTGIPIGPRGVTGAAIVGSLLHPSAASADEPRRDSGDGGSAIIDRSSESSSSYDSGSSSSSSSYDSGSSSSSYDSGSSSGGSSSFD